MFKAKKRVVLVIRDGWGYRKESKNNPIKLGKPVFTEKLMKNYPNVLINTCGEAVGDPKGYQGNSEVGHITMGSGRILWQPLMRIGQSIESGKFFQNKAIIGAIKHCKHKKSTLHVMGLLQSEGVHSHEDHLYAILELCKRENFENVIVHVFTDGRDAPVNNGIKHVEKLLGKMKQLGFGKIGTISGRYYAMDRDKRWNRTKKAYDAIVAGEGEQFADILKTIKQLYKKKETDEFIKPKVSEQYTGVRKHDGMIFFNFRTDRPRQLTQSIVEKKFEGWERNPLDVYYVGMTNFYKPMNAKVAFDDIKIKKRLGQIISKKWLRQLRISETEKYAHVTFFFNGQVEKPNRREDRILVHSPQVPTYDLKPEMSALEIAERLAQQLEKDYYDFVVVNIVNGDLVGHTGNFNASKKAVKSVDECLKKIVETGLEHNYTLLITADHGNIEDQTPKWRTSHTMNPVPFIVVSNDEELKSTKLKTGKGLSDIAPTILDIMGIKKPKQMTGESIINKLENPINK